MSYNEGLKLFRAGDYGGAIEEFQKVLEDNQEDSKSWNALGVTLSKLGDTENALTCFENAKNLDSTNESYTKNYHRLKKPKSLANKKKRPKLSLASGLIANKKIIIGFASFMVIILIIITLIPVVIGHLNGMGGVKVVKSGPVVEAKNGMITMSIDGRDIDSVKTVHYVINGNTDYPFIEKPQREIFYSIIDPYPHETKHFTMTVEYDDGMMQVVIDTDLPPQP